MALVPGMQFGSFEVLLPIGVGGMGEVFRARDTRLNREVALKVLPDAVALDPDRLARFTREAQVLASLNHPNIAAIFGVEHAQDQHALVLELVEGPTLADRLDDGPIPLDEALPVARQIAEALEAAHGCGVVHRDVKPANIKLRTDGTVKVLDFGLAKPSERPGSVMSAPPGVTASPTLLSPAVTGAGIILGTAAYMSPEQARGRVVDQRADIWAFGCVLFEMLTGRRAFDGAAMADTLAGVLRADPPWESLPHSTPRGIRRLLRRCLEKDPRNRLQSMGDARIEIADALSRRDEGSSRTRSRSASPGWIFPTVVASALTAFVVAGAMWLTRPTLKPSDTVTRALLGAEPFDMRRPLRDGAARPRLPRPDRTAVALSPDGRTLVYRAFVVDATPNGGTQSQLLMRRLDSLTATPIDTTTGADSPFFSPNGAWIGYWDAGELRRVPFTSESDSSFTTITKVPDGARVTGVSWGDDEWVIFATATGLWRAPAGGGPPDQIARVGANENARILPHVLPGSKAFLFTRQQTAFQWDNAQIVVRSLNGTEKVLLEDAADARYVTSGHLVFVRRGKLMAAPFDLDRLELTGAPVAVVSDVMQAANMPNSVADSGAGQFDVSAQGTLVYVTGGMQRNDPTELVWLDRAGGAVTPVGVPQGTFGGPRLSPDGQRILMFSGAAPANGNRLWVFDLVRRTHTAISGPDERIVWGTWSPDGTRIAFQRLEAGRGVLYVRPADGTGTSEPLVEPRPLFQTPGSWSLNGKLAFVELSETSAIRILDVNAGDRVGTVAVQSKETSAFPALSPDGNWLAYAADTSGRREVYVQPFPGPGPRVLISTGGGTAPTWRADGRELYYYSVNDGVMHMFAVPISPTGTTLTAGAPHELFQGNYGTTSPARGYDVSPDGRRFLLVRGVESAPVPTQMVLVENWLQELKQQVQ